MMNKNLKSFVDYLFIPKGRASRYEYWTTLLAFCAIASILSYLTFLNAETAVVFCILMCVIIGIPATWFKIVFTIRRLHDLGKSAKYLLFCLIPVIGHIYLVVNVCFMKGQDGPNCFGENRREEFYLKCPVWYPLFFLLIFVVVMILFVQRAITYYG